MIISPSIASADLLHAAEEVRFICGHFPDLHVDIEDGVHLDNISFGFRLARMICEAATRPVSLHLMVNDPIHWIPDVQRCGAAVTFVHLDHLRDPAAALDAYRRAGIPVGLGLSSRDLHRGDWKALAAQTDAAHLRYRRSCAALCPGAGRLRLRTGPAFRQAGLGGRRDRFPHACRTGGRRRLCRRNGQSRLP